MGGKSLPGDHHPKRSISTAFSSMASANSRFRRVFASPRPQPLGVRHLHPAKLGVLIGVSPQKGATLEIFRTKVLKPGFLPGVGIAHGAGDR